MHSQHFRRFRPIHDLNSYQWYDLSFPDDVGQIFIQPNKMKEEDLSSRPAKFKLLNADIISVTENNTNSRARTHIHTHINWAKQKNLKNHFSLW